MKQKLAELIETYASARVSGSRVLIDFAASQLNGVLQSVCVTSSENKVLGAGATNTTACDDQASTHSNDRDETYASGVEKLMPPQSPTARKP